MPKTIAESPLQNKPALMRQIFRPVEQDTLAVGRAKLSNHAETDWRVHE